LSNGIDRRRFLLTSLAGALAAPLAAEAQQAGTFSRIGYLSSHSPETFRIEAFRQGLRELGLIEGRNLTIAYRSADGKFDRLPELAAELVRLKVDVIVAVPTVSVVAAKRATQTIPIVFTHVSDPVGSGLVPALARPAGNVTGFTHVNVGLTPKRLEFLKEAIPNVGRVVALWHPGGLGDRTEEILLKEAETGARALRMQLQFLEVRGPSDFDRAFGTAARDGASALVVLPSPLLLSEHRRVVDLVAKTRLPTVYFAREFAEVGGLLSYGVDTAQILRGAASYVDKILKGAKPADLPVEQGAKFELVINLKTAKALGLTIPPSLLARADQIIE
jgi:putative ABC transport system substrate-binding protein